MRSRFRQAFGPVKETDHALSQAIFRLSPSWFDDAMKIVSRAANHSVLWFIFAIALGSRRGASRKAALRGVAAIAGASFTANAVMKPLLPRRRPPAFGLRSEQVLANPPISSSFPSGHAASAAAFTVAVAMESPRLGLGLAPFAAAVGYSRVHVGVHWASDVAAGAVLGAGIAAATRRWWPVRTTDEAIARPLDTVPKLAKGAGLVLVSNQRAGNQLYDPADDLSAALPEAVVLRAERDVDIGHQLDQAVAARSGTVQAIGVAGGDGTAAAAASVANRWKLPMVVIPSGTLNHFARDVGVYDVQEALDAIATGEAVAVDVALVDVHREHGNDPTSRAVVRTHCFINTASLGSYPDLVRLRERWETRWGKWPAFAAALILTLRNAEPVNIKIEGEWHSVWLLFVGNGRYHPRGMVPAWRPRLDSGRLDVRWLRADLRFSQLRAIVAMALGALGHSRVYQQREVTELDVELAVPGTLATDGEIVERAGRFTFRVADRPISVYRRHERRWVDRHRPYVG